MRIGITGTRQGMTADQTKVLEALLHRLVFAEGDAALTELHYGDCVGVDAEVAEAVLDHELGHVLHCHPATKDEAWDKKWRANTAQAHPGKGIVVYPAKEPLQRNVDIVDSCDVLWAFPANMNNKGGTWHTINKALEVGRYVRIVGPVVDRFHALSEELSH